MSSSFRSLIRLKSWWGLLILFWNCVLRGVLNQSLSGGWPIVIITCLILWKITTFLWWSSTVLLTHRSLHSSRLGIRRRLWFIKQLIFTRMLWPRSVKNLILTLVDTKALPYRLRLRRNQLRQVILSDVNFFLEGSIINRVSWLSDIKIVLSSESILERYLLADIRFLVFVVHRLPTRWLLWIYGLYLISAVIRLICSIAREPHNFVVIWWKTCCSNLLWRSVFLHWEVELLSSYL